ADDGIGVLSVTGVQTCALPISRGPHHQRREDRRGDRVGPRESGVVIIATGFTRAAPIASLVVATLMVRSAVGLLRDSGRVLLEAAPAGMDVSLIGHALVSDPRVTSIHDLHVWEIGTDFPALSAHVLVHPGDDCHAVR